VHVRSSRISTTDSILNLSRWANATLGANCTVENTPYIAYGASGEFIDIVSRYDQLILLSFLTDRLCRGNCQLGLYCDSVQTVCMTSKLFGTACAADKE
jgi:hypothetical protein